MMKQMGRIVVLGVLMVSCGDSLDKKPQQNLDDPNRPESLCGNGILDPGEDCDPLSSGADRCPTECTDSELECVDVVLIGNASDCTARCEVRPLGCVDGDGCCSMGCDSLSDSDCTNVCGDNVTDSNETCDGDCPTTCDDNNACTTDNFTGSAETCSLVCSNTPRTSCLDNDGCCPAGCTFEDDNDCSEACVPTNSCVELDANCGTINTGCSTVDCGTCSGGETCKDNRCTVNTPTTYVGSACVSDGQCGAGLACYTPEAGATGGYCTRQCRSDSQCGSGAHCGQKNSEGNGSCLKSCSSTTECGRTSYECFDSDRAGRAECWVVGSGSAAIGEACSNTGECSGGQGAICLSPRSNFYQGYCSKYCNSDSECGTGSHCSLLGLCVKSSCSRTTGYSNHDIDEDGRSECWRSATGSLPVGASCAAQWECGGGTFGTCLREDRNGLPGGYCTIYCHDGTVCPNGSACSEVSQDVFLCVDSCEDDASCRENYACYATSPESGPICWL